MSRIGPIRWKTFVARMRQFGFDGPYQEGKHPYMVKGSVILTVPNPHEGDISIDLLIRLLRQAGIKREEWLGKK